MPLSTLDPTVKQALTDAGVTLSPAQEHVAAAAQASGFDWIGLLTKLGQLAVQIIPLIIGIFAKQQKPTRAIAAGCCDHHCLCCETMEFAALTYQVAALHCCECCCEGGYG